MNNSEKFSCCASRQHKAFHTLFFGGMWASLWFQWGPWSHVVWDTNCVVASTLAAAQLILYAFRYHHVRRAEWQPTLAGEGSFFAVNLAICLAEFRCGVPYYPWVFLVFLGYMLAALPKPCSWIIGAVATLLYVPMQVGWSHVGTLSFPYWINWLGPVAFTWLLGLMYRRLLDTNEERASLIEELQGAKKSLELARDREGELATLRERERLARDLHDTLGHQLVTLTVQLEAAQRLVAVNPPQAAAALEEMQKLSRASMDDLRRALDDLRASGLGGRPLVAALQSLCADTGRRLGLPVDCQLAAGADGVPSAVAEVLWCVAQEGLTNVGRHAQAHRIQVNLNLLPQAIILRVADDGAGFPVGAEGQPGHYGLRGLRERVEGLGGTFTLATPKGGGASIEARLPIIP
jgi:signal transduction histidine kinase